jgi:hypothetical protein
MRKHARRVRGLKASKRYCALYSAAIARSLA